MALNSSHYAVLEKINQDYDNVSIYIETIRKEIAKQLASPDEVASNRTVISYLSRLYAILTNDFTTTSRNHTITEDILNELVMFKASSPEDIISYVIGKIRHISLSL